MNHPKTPTNVDLAVRAVVLRQMVNDLAAGQGTPPDADADPWRALSLVTTSGVLALMDWAVATEADTRMEIRPGLASLERLLMNQFEMLCRRFPEFESVKLRSDLDLPPGGIIGRDTPLPGEGDLPE